MVCLSRPYPFKFFKGCLPQILLGPFLNTCLIYWLLYYSKSFFLLFCRFIFYLIVIFLKIELLWLDVNFIELAILFTCFTRCNSVSFCKMIASLKLWTLHKSCVVLFVSNSLKLSFMKVTSIFWGNGLALSIVEQNYQSRPKTLSNFMFIG